MTNAAASDRSLAIVCGSDTLAGGEIVSRLSAMDWGVFTVDPVRASFHPDATFAMHGDLGDESLWASLQIDLGAMDRQPRLFVHAISAAPGDSPASVSRIVPSAELGCRYVMPLLPEGGAVVFLTSVLGIWDIRADAADFGASQAGLLGLMRAQALIGATSGVRVNAICAGLVADPTEDIPPDLVGRIPLGKPAAPADVADAALFLLFPDARHITGSTLVVDGGQSLQSWSNAPRALTPLPPSPIAMGEGGTRRSENRTVLITGAAGGLGSAAARRFAADGANLALLDRDGEAAEQLANELATQGIDSLALAVDVTNAEAVENAISRVEQHFGRLDVLFNNAGVGSGSFSIAELPPEEWDRVIAINLRGVFLGCKYGVPALARSGGGAIVNMGSSTGRHDTITGGAAYMASKAAVEAMTKSLALQIAPLAIRANTICPGIIQTQLSFRQQERGDEVRFFAEFAARIPLGRVGQPEDVAAAVAFLASDQARHITGSSLLIDGGQTMRKWINAPDLAFDMEGMPT
jgi:NAD(P)-dependent dehydrogenase (short-subunit alcohol dehydrogenase family)